jgi:hypothetical protein
MLRGKQVKIETLVVSNGRKITFQLADLAEGHSPESSEPDLWSAANNRTGVGRGNSRPDKTVGEVRLDHEIYGIAPTAEPWMIF